MAKKIYSSGRRSRRGVAAQRGCRSAPVPPAAPCPWPPAPAASSCEQRRSPRSGPSDGAASCRREARCQPALATVGWLAKTLGWVHGACPPERPPPAGVRVVILPSERTSTNERSSTNERTSTNEQKNVGAIDRSIERTNELWPLSGGIGDTKQETSEMPIGALMSPGTLDRIPAISTVLRRKLRRKGPSEGVVADEELRAIPHPKRKVGQGNHAAQGRCADAKNGKLCVLMTDR